MGGRDLALEARHLSQQLEFLYKEIAIKLQRLDEIHKKLAHKEG